MLYALYLYQWRAHKIRNRGIWESRNWFWNDLAEINQRVFFKDPGPYDDRYGPTVLVLILFMAVMTNFYLKYLDMQKSRD